MVGTYRKLLKLTAFAACITCLLFHPAFPAAYTAEAYSSPKEHKAKRQLPKAKSPDMSWVNLHNRFPGAFLTHGPRKAKRIALTFDDAPDARFTPAILDILAQYDVCATFFVVGARAADNPDLVRRIHREGHIIGNHSYDHAVMSKLTLAQYRNQIRRTDSILNGIVGYSPHFVRPPYGEVLPEQVKWSEAAGYTIVNWDVDSSDWRNNPSSRSVLSSIQETLQPGSIVLQHAGGGIGQDLSGTIGALPQLIELLRGKGYELVTLPELLGQPANRRQ